MKHVKKFEGFKNNKPEVKIEDKVNETVLQLDNVYKVIVAVDIEQKFLSSYAKKVKQNTNKDITDIYGNAMLAEELVHWVLKNGLDVEKIPANALIGGAQGQAQAQSQPGVQVDSQAQAQPQAQVEAQPQAQPQGQAQDFEEVQKKEEEGGAQNEELPV